MSYVLEFVPVPGRPGWYRPADGRPGLYSQIDVEILDGWVVDPRPTDSLRAAPQNAVSAGAFIRECLERSGTIRAAQQMATVIKNLKPPAPAGPAPVEFIPGRHFEDRMSRQWQDLDAELRLRLAKARPGPAGTCACGAEPLKTTGIITWPTGERERVCEACAEAVAAHLAYRQALGQGVPGCRCRMEGTMPTCLSLSSVAGRVDLCTPCAVDLAGFLQARRHGEARGQTNLRGRARGQSK
jgi:hypothetical protein